MSTVGGSLVVNLIANTAQFRSGMLAAQRQIGDVEKAISSASMVEKSYAKSASDRALAFAVQTEQFHSRMAASQLKLSELSSSRSSSSVTNQVQDRVAASRQNMGDIAKTVSNSTSAALAHFDAEINKCDADAKKFTEDIRKSAQQVRQLRKEASDAAHSLLQMGSSMGGAALRSVGRIGGLALGVAGVGGIGFGIKLAADMEQAEIAFGVMLGSADKAKKTLGDLKSFADTTPFEFPELRDAAKSLIAFGVNTTQLIPTMRRLGDVASGIGIPIGELSQIYGKAKVQGRLFAEDVNQLTGRGIPVIQEFAKQFGVTENEVKKLVESGKISFSNLEEAFRSLTAEGGRFYGMTEKQSQSLSGLFSTMKDSIGNSLMKIGQALIKELDLKKVVTDLTAFISRIEGPMISAVVAVVKFMKDWGKTILLTTTAIVAAQLAIMTINAALKAYAIAQAVALALTGPKGWAILAGAAIAAGVAIVGVNYALSEAAEAAQSASPDFESIGGTFDDSAGGAAAFSAELDGVTSAIRRAVAKSPELADLVDIMGGENEVAKLAKKANDEFEDPFEKMTEKQKELNRLFELGLIGAETLGQGLKKSAEEYDRAIGGPAAKIKEMKLDIESFGKSSQQKLLAGFERDGKATDEQIAEVRQLAEQLDNLNAGKKMKEEAEKIIEGSRSPAEKLEEQLKKIDKLHDEGLLSDREFASAIDKANKDEHKGEKKEKPGHKGSEVALAGSKEAFDSIVRGFNLGNGDPAKETAKNTEKMAEGIAQLVIKSEEGGGPGFKVAEFS